MKVLVLANSLITERRYLEEVCKKLSSGNDVIYYNSDIDKYIRIFEKNKIWLRKIKFLPFGKKLFEYLCYKYVDSISKKILIRVNPEILILGTDNTYFSPFFVKNSKYRNIKSVVIPFTLANQEELVHYCRTSRQYFQPLVSINIYLLFFKKWFIEDEKEKGKYFLCPIYPHFFIQEILKIAPRNPWIVCGGNSDYVFVNSQFEKDYYVKSGINEERIMIYGLRQNDNFDISNHNAVQANDNYILWSVPPDHLNSKLFESQKQLIEWHLELFSESDWKIVVSPHPRIPHNYFDSFKLPLNVFISYESIHSLVSDCTYFIASQSATIRFALANKKFIINFKVYNLPYTEYSDMPMVCEVQSLVDFRKVFYRMQSGDLFKGFEYDNFEYDYFESRGSHLTTLLEQISF